MGKCSVPYCNNFGGFRFPKLDPEALLIWKLRIQNPDMDNMTDDQINKKYRVCKSHFSEFCFRIDNRCLIPRSLPTLNVPGFEGDNTVENSILPSDSKSLGICAGNAITIARYGVQCPQLDGALGGSPLAEIPAEASSSPGPAESTTMGISILQTPKRKQHLLQKGSLLRMVSAGRSSHLTPRARRMHRMCSSLRKIARSTLREKESVRNKLKNMEKLIQDGGFMLNKVNKVTFNFIMSQLNLQDKRPKGRRFLLNDKLFALALYKQSPKMYRFLQKIFALPSKSTLRTLTNQVPLACGLNQFIINNLKSAASQMEPLDRQCVLMFDEISLQANLQYDPQSDSVIGFEDYGDGNRQTSFADHALVFMAKGLRRPWKQPICYYFNEGGVKSYQLASLIKLVLNSLFDVGLNVLATVCDQYSANSAAYNILIKETYEECLKTQREYRFHDVFTIGEHEIIPIFDPPHLLKGIRNNLLGASVKFTWKTNTQQTAFWNDIVTIYEHDCEDTDNRMLHKLTDSHLYPDKMNKMKVKLAAQVFSQRVSATISGLVRFNAAKGVPATAADTADFLLFMDKLFDSVNGSGLDRDKPLRCAITDKSPHTKFWNEALVVLKSIKFIKNCKETVPPTVKNWIFTIKNLSRFWDKYNQNFKFLNIRNLNQDPLENFFGCIRSHGVRNINPSCASFQNSFKALVINNIFLNTSANSNCEEDGGYGTCLKYFFHSL